MQNVSRTAGRGHWIDKLGRAGYAAKAVVYLIIGYICLQGVASTGSKDALTQIGQEPFGQVMLAVVGLGLLAYAIWRFALGFVDHDNEGDDATGIGKRIGYVVSGIIYTGLAFVALQIILGSGSGGSGGSQHWTGKLLGMNGGRILVGVVALGVIAGGLNQLKEAIKADFADEFRRADMSSTEMRWATRVGRVGHAARFVIYGIIGWFLARAAWLANADEVKGFSGALQTVREQPYGPWLLVATGAGFICYSAMCAVMARYRY